MHISGKFPIPGSQISIATPTSPGVITAEEKVAIAGWMDGDIPGSPDAFESTTISAGGITGFGAARKLYLLGGGTLCGINATGCVAGTTLECTIDADTDISTTNTTGYAGIVMPSGAAETLSLAQYERFSLQLIAPTGGSAFWKFRF